MPNRFSWMSSLFMIHITPMILFKLSIQIYLHTNDWNIFLIDEELVHSSPCPFRLLCRGGNTFYKEHINNFSQTGSDKVKLKYATDNTRSFLVNDNFIVTQNIAIWKFHNHRPFLKRK